MRIFTVYIINMKRSRQCILPEIIKPQKSRKSSASHASHQCTFLRIKTIRPYTLMSEQMQCLILICIIGFLKNSYIIYAAFMKILILIYVYRINFNSDVFEIFPSNFTASPIYSTSEYFRLSPVSSSISSIPVLAITCISCSISWKFNFFCEYCYNN